MNLFEGKTALITGAAVGIGRACALQMAKNGAYISGQNIQIDGCRKKQ